MSNLIQTSILDIPNEILEDNLFTRLSFNDLISLMNIGNARLFRCCNAVILKKPFNLKKEWFENAKGGNLENMKCIYKILKENGNEEDIKEWRGPYHRTILMEATRLGRQNIIKWLLQEFQFDVNEQSSDGSTALHIAAYHNQIECARLLLDLGSQQLQAIFGITPLDVAWEEEMQKLLRSHFH